MCVSYSYVYVCIEVETPLLFCLTPLISEICHYKAPLMKQVRKNYLAYQAELAFAAAKKAEGSERTVDSK